ncbi:OLC1v1027116C1 [Oldenlandia corymbosa var. corymbosa]|uniref:OLC1v1027116C1 n=1 Tax=Oldenlandia corymbosa var. corymbosa TaxID=529605 RepID=A0AAV1C8P9_OLDCO|nr:OLC1v1027116C1 [Oldenlandia corymbosa var. corymbosa]
MAGFGSLPPPSPPFPLAKKQKSSINDVNDDILYLIFASLDVLELVGCSAVCKSWGSLFERFNLLLSKLYNPQLIEQLAMERHRSSLVGGSASVFQWIGHSSMDGNARVFDIYSRRCCRVMKVQSVPVTCLSLNEGQLLMCGSSFGAISISDFSSDRPGMMLVSKSLAEIKTLCFNPGSTPSCWRNKDTSVLVVGGIDGVLRILDQNTGEVLSRCIVDESNRSSVQLKGGGGHQVIEKKAVRRLQKDERLDLMSVASRPSITCLAVGMEKVVTMNKDKCIRMWKFLN